MRATSSCRARSLRLSIILSLILAAVGIGSAQPAAAQSYTVLHGFELPPSNPYAGLVQGSDGNFYGTTYAGGTSSAGTVFQMTPSGTLTTLHSFASSDGAYPFAGLVQGTDGNFYGTTERGGANDSGTVFQMTPSGTLTTLHSFSSSDGATPFAGLVQGTDGNFYGTTYGGGASGYGTVFQMTPSGTLTTLHSFSSSDGANPFAGLVQGTDGNFYGTTFQGGASSYGTAFQMTPSGTLTTLHSFSSSDGASPTYAGLIQGSDGNFYGTTYQGGASNSGTIFQMTPSGTLTTLHSFSTSDGAYPHAGLIQGTDGNFYGTTEGGGAGAGTVFRMTPSGTLTTLHSFTLSDGAYPSAGLIQGTDRDFYGTTVSGGPLGGGVVFKLVPAPNAAVSGGGTICAGGSATIQAALTGTPPWSLTWSDGVTQSGLTASPATRSVSPGSTATYIVTAFSDASGPGASSGGATVTVNAKPMAVAFGAVTIILGQSTPLSGSGGVSCTWSPSTGLSDPGSCSPIATPLVTTTYMLTVAGANGCLSMNNPAVTVTVDPPIVAAVTPAGATTFCSSENVTLNASASGGTGTFRSWQWFRNGVAIRGATSSLSVAWSPGSYTIAARDSAGFVSTSPPTAVTVTGR